jgi:hypothetical protein
LYPILPKFSADQPTQGGPGSRVGRKLGRVDARVSLASASPSLDTAHLEHTKTAYLTPSDMSDLNSWEEDPAAQDENLARQAQQQMNLGNQQAQGSFRAGAASFQPGAQSFQPGQTYGGNYAPQYQQQQYYGGQGYYPQYAGGQQQQQNFSQYGQQGQGYGNVYGQGDYSQGYGEPH